MMKKTPGGRRLIPIKNLILMLVSLVVILATVFAWYTNNDKVTAEKSSISAKSADNIEFALPVKEANGNFIFPISNDNWSTELDFKESGFFTDFVKDVTSDGQQFAVPNFEAAKGLKEGRKVITDDVWVDGISSKEALINTQPNDDDQYNYISFDFYVRAKQKDINVLGESFLAAGSELGINENGEKSEKKLLKGTSIYRKSTYGAADGNANAFSADAIVGAMRVSIVGQPVASVSTGSGTVTETLSGSPALKFLWLPRPDVYLNTDNNQNNWQLTTGVTKSNELAAQTYVHSFYHGETISGDVKKGLTRGAYSDENVKSFNGTTHPAYFAVSKAADETKLGTLGYYPTLGQTKALVSDAPEASKSIQFTAGTEAGDNRETIGYYVYKLTLNVWIEGEDAEARRSMNKGLFNLELDFGS